MRDINDRVVRAFRKEHFTYDDYEEKNIEVNDKVVMIFGKEPFEYDETEKEIIENKIITGVVQRIFSDSSVPYWVHSTKLYKVLGDDGENYIASKSQEELFIHNYPIIYSIEEYLNYNEYLIENNNYDINEFKTKLKILEKINRLLTKNSNELVEKEKTLKLK